MGKVLIEIFSVNDLTDCGVVINEEDGKLFIEALLEFQTKGVPMSLIGGRPGSIGSHHHVRTSTVLAQRNSHHAAPIPQGGVFGALTESTGGVRNTLQKQQQRKAPSHRAAADELYKPLKDCTSADVGKILDSLNLGEYKEAFQAGGITGRVLCQLETAAELEECGVTLGTSAAEDLFSSLQFYKSNGVSRALL